MVVHPSVPAKSVPEFIAYAKANPGKINVESTGAGTSNHLAGELFKLMTGVDLVHIQYRGSGPALTDLLAGQVQVGFDTMPGSIEYIRAGRLRALAVGTLVRSEALPDIPTVNEFVPGYESSGYFGLSVPKNTPLAIVERLNGEIKKLVAQPDVKEKLETLGFAPVADTPAEFAERIKTETVKWSKVINDAKIKIE